MGGLRQRGPEGRGRVPRPGDPRSRRSADAGSAGWLQESSSIGIDDDGRPYIKGDAPELVALEQRIEALEAVIDAAGKVT